jgi:hypothetical protein
MSPPFSTPTLDGSELSASPPLAPMASGADPRCPLDRKLGGPQGRSGRYGEDKNLASAARSLSLYRLSYPGTSVRYRWFRKCSLLVAEPINFFARIKAISYFY